MGNVWWELTFVAAASTDAARCGAPSQSERPMAATAEEEERSPEQQAAVVRGDALALAKLVLRPAAQSTYSIDDKNIDYGVAKESLVHCAAGKLLWGSP